MNPFEGFVDKFVANSPFDAGANLESCETKTKRDLAMWFSGISFRLRSDREESEKDE